MVSPFLHLIHFISSMVHVMPLSASNGSTISEYQKRSPKLMYDPRICLQELTNHGRHDSQCASQGQNQELTKCKSEMLQTSLTLQILSKLTSHKALKVKYPRYKALKFAYICKTFWNPNTIHVSQETLSPSFLLLPIQHH